MFRTFPLAASMSRVTLPAFLIPSSMTDQTDVPRLVGDAITTIDTCLVRPFSLAIVIA